MGHKNIDLDEARKVALEVPQVFAEDLTRILHPERCLTLDQLERYPADRILGARVATALGRRN